MTPLVLCIYVNLKGATPNPKGPESWYCAERKTFEMASRQLQPLLVEHVVLTSYRAGVKNSNRHDRVLKQNPVR